MPLLQEKDESLPRWCVVAPVFNNVATVGAVVEAIVARGLPVIVVDDGSRDGTAEVLRDLVERLVAVETVTHPANRGKAAALRTGFARAAELGFTHVLTIDTDGQHDVADVAPLLQRSHDKPGSIVVGVRHVGKIGRDYPVRSWIGRQLSNGLVWAIGGVCVSDSQCGLRAYPLAVVRELGARTSRYAFETEVLARAGWARVSVEEVDIKCIYDVPGGRVSHFAPWADSWSATVMHARLLTRSVFYYPRHKLGDNETSGTLLERTVHWMNPLRTWRKVRVDAAERDRVAASMGWGIVVGYSPFFGIKTVACLVLSKLFKLQPLIVIGTSSLASPPMGAVVWAMSIAVGHLMLHGQLPTPDRYNFAAGPAAVFRQVALEWVIGATLCGTVLGALTWALVRAAWRRIGFAEVATTPKNT